MLTLAYLIVEAWKALWKPRVGVGVARKSSFRTLQNNKTASRPVIAIRHPTRDQQEEQERREEDSNPQQPQRLSWAADSDAFSVEPPSPISPVFVDQQLQQQQQQQQQQYQQAAAPFQQAQPSPSSMGLLGAIPSSSTSTATTTTTARATSSSASSGTAAGEDRKVIAGRGIPVPVPSKQVVPSGVSKPTPSSGIQEQAAPTDAATTHAAPPSDSTCNQHQQQQPSHIPMPVQTSSKTLVLKPSVSGNRMDETWAKKQLDKFSFGFDEADKDKSGSLSLDEVCAVMQESGFKGSKEELQFIFGQMDKDGSKTVSRDEFKAAMWKVPRMSIREFVYRKAFKQMDKDNSGCLTKQEIMDATKNEGGIQIGSKVISDLLIYLSGHDDNDKVDYEEFLRVMGIEAAAEVMKKVFQAIDKDGSGTLTRAEMMDATSKEFELNLSARLISTLLVDLVHDDDKQMNYQEFIKSWLNQRSAKRS